MQKVITLATFVSASALIVALIANPLPETSQQADFSTPQADAELTLESDQPSTAFLPKGAGDHFRWPWPKPEDRQPPRAVGSEFEMAPAVGAEFELTQAIGAEFEVKPRAVGAEFELTQAIGAEFEVKPRAVGAEFEVKATSAQSPVIVAGP